MREKYYRHAINTAVRNLKLYNNDPVLRFFKAFATLMEGRLKCAFMSIFFIFTRVYDNIVDYYDG